MSEQLTAIHKSIKFIEAHLRDEVTVADIAAAAGYTLYHFIRVFNQAVHHTPYDYLIRRRLSESAKELVNNQRRIVNISLDYGFNNHETFSRAFKRMFLMQPIQWRARGLIPYRALLPAFTKAYLEHINRGGVTNPKFIERNDTELVGLMTKGRTNNEELLENLKFILLDNNYPFRDWGFYRIHMILQNSISFSFLGTPAISREESFPPLSTLHLPAGAYVKFSHNGRQKELQHSLNYIYNTWLVKSNYKLQHPYEIEYFTNSLPEVDSNISKWEIQLPINH